MSLTIQEKIKNSISQINPFSELECQIIEQCVDNLVHLGENGVLRPNTLDVVPLRKKYFFGEGYTYGSQMSKKGPGMERLYPMGYVDPIPPWIFSYVINPLVMANIIPRDFVNSVAINDYSPGGCIVSHIDPIHLFERPIISLSLFSESALCFGCKFEFKPIRCSNPVYKLDLPRGIITILSGFAANEITHCVRPMDTKYRRAVILLRRVKEDAPRLSLELPIIKPKFVDFTSRVENKGFVRKSEGFVAPSEKIIQINRKQFKKCRKRERKPTDIIAKQNINAKVFFADNLCYTKFPYKL